MSNLSEPQCRTDVQDAIHAPHIDWETCSSGSVYSNGTTGFPGRDQSVGSALSVLPNVIEKSVRSVVVHGLAVSCPLPSRYQVYVSQVVY